MAQRFPLSSARIRDVLQAPKRIVKDIHDVLIHAHSGVKGIEFRIEVEMMDEGYLPMQLIGRATDPTDPQTYHIVLTAHGERLRGVDYQRLAKRKGYKIKIPAGWHQNVCDPNLPSRNDEDNRHDAMPDFRPADFLDFVRKVAAKWKIDLGEKDELL